MQWACSGETAYVALRSTSDTQPLPAVSRSARAASSAVFRLLHAGARMVRQVGATLSIAGNQLPTSEVSRLQLGHSGHPNRDVRFRADRRQPGRERPVRSLLSGAYSASDGNGGLPTLFAQSCHYSLRVLQRHYGLFWK